MQTRIVDKDDNILMVFINELYVFPDVLRIGKRDYGKVCTEDSIVKKGILRIIHAKVL